MDDIFDSISNVFYSMKVLSKSKRTYPFCSPWFLLLAILMSNLWSSMTLVIKLQLTSLSADRWNEDSSSIFFRTAGISTGIMKFLLKVGVTSITDQFFYTLSLQTLSNHITNIFIIQTDFPREPFWSLTLQSNYWNWPSPQLFLRSCVITTSNAQLATSLFLIFDLISTLTFFNYRPNILMESTYSTYYLMNCQKI